MIRFGILGAGHFAAAHVQALQRMPERARVTGYARREAGKAFAEAEALGARAFTLDGLIASDDVDVVCVCVPNHLHRAYAEAALSAGKHVFCEKPLALSVEDADAMLDAANESGRTLMVGHLARHIPAYVAVADIFAEGRLGVPRAAYVSRMHCGGGRSWRMDPIQGGGVVFDLLIHDIDLLRWYLGRPQRLVARGHRHVQGGYDYVGALLTYAGGMTAVVEGGFVFRPPAGQGLPERIIPVKLDNLLIEGLVSEFTEFLDTLDGASPMRLHLQDARDAVAVASAIVQSADAGSEIVIA
ncbi:MAG: Gfo/Idh/MocA family oxidoreductase [Candidatus Hydrogenedentes bacterium]|nr:Gfo/Idh/MocA family oxidoreductase [Candidatus Hydrogenedentota bacterium]